MPAGGQLSVLATRGEWVYSMLPGIGPKGVRRRLLADGRSACPLYAFGAGQPRV